LIEVEQRLRIRHIELHSVEETESENVTAIVCKVAEKLGVRISEEDVEAAHRVPTRIENCPKTIVVELKSRKIVTKLCRKEEVRY
jgi:hypothetical protein